MENNENKQENLNAKAPDNQEQHDLDFLHKAEKARPDTNKDFENAEARLGDVHPIDRVDTSQEEANANAQGQPDVSKT